MNTHKFFKGKKVFITGHTGFKGTWLTIWMEMLGAHVLGYALKPEKNSLHNRVLKNLHCRSVFADVRNSKKLNAEILKFKPDFIFHLAAQPIVRESYRIPVETFEVNTIGTANVLNAARFLKNNCSILVITTDKVYDHVVARPFAENDRLGGHDPYSASKAAAELVTESFRLSFFSAANPKEHKISVSTVRAGNVIGGGDYAADRIIPDIIRAQKKKQKLIVRNPDAIRPWQHVLEPLSGYLLLAEKLASDPIKFSEPFNFGPEQNDVLTVKQLTQLAIKEYAPIEIDFKIKKGEFHEAASLRLNISKSKTKLRWMPVYSSNESIVRTMRWYRDVHIEGGNAFQRCVQDINEFESLKAHKMPSKK